MDLQDKAVYIASAARTPHGSYRGALSQFSATQLGSYAIKASLERVPQIKPDDVDEVLVGNVLSANLGQNPARQCALGAGLPVSVACSSINKVCASGLKAVTLGAQSIMTGHADTVVAGGTESMTNCPMYMTPPKAALPSSKSAKTKKPAPPMAAVSGMVKDGLTDPYGEQEVMGLKAEHTARQKGVSREQQDHCAIESYEKMTAAYSNGWLSSEIASIKVEANPGEFVMLDRDEPLQQFSAEKLVTLKSAFDKAGGSVTAGNTSSISDGASAAVLVSGAKARQLHITPVARIVDWADAELDPQDFIMAPSLAIETLMKRAKVSVSDVDVFEINEAFAVSALANLSEMGLDSAKLNVHGGSLAIGHPLGSSGCRILVSLLTVMKRKRVRLGCACVCNGGGGATAILVELVDQPVDVRTNSSS